MFRTGFTRWLPQPFYADDGGGGGGGDKKDQVVFENNEALETLIKGRVDSAVALATKNASKGGVTAEEKAELEKLRKESEDRERKDKEARGQYDAALKSQEESIRKEYEPKLTAEKQRADQAQQQLEAKVIGQAVAEAAGQMNAVDPAQVRQLLAAEFKMNDRYEAIVVEADGTTQRFVAGKPMTPAQRVEEFLKANPHMVRSTAGDGGGAGGGKTQKTGDVSAIAAAEAKVKTLEDEALKSGSPRALAAHAAAVRELDTLKKKTAA